MSSTATTAAGGAATAAAGGAATAAASTATTATTAAAAVFSRKAGENSSSESSGAGLAAAMVATTVTTQKPSCKTLGKYHKWDEDDATRRSDGRWVALCYICERCIFVSEPRGHRDDDYDPEANGEREANYHHWKTTGDM